MGIGWSGQPASSLVAMYSAVIFVLGLRLSNTYLDITVKVMSKQIEKYRVLPKTLFQEISSVAGFDNEITLWKVGAG